MNADQAERDRLVWFGEDSVPQLLPADAFGAMPMRCRHRIGGVRQLEFHLPGGNLGDSQLLNNLWDHLAFNSRNLRDT